eukprot:GEMP01058572.1.p1 GENE.GEMP01058572.1~~GEMP01058572.1.p1  ORF type:complete len:153 (+),score=33.85 GEMP01058572.1:74-532(+)
MVAARFLLVCTFWCGAHANVDAHVLDITKGRGAGMWIELEQYIQQADVEVKTRQLATSDEKPLEVAKKDHWVLIAKKMSHDSGRTDPFIKGDVTPGTYRFTFQTEEYFSKSAQETFFPYVQVIFQVKNGQEKEDFHVPITISPFGYSTYRGV